MSEINIPKRRWGDILMPDGNFDSDSIMDEPLLKTYVRHTRQDGSDAWFFVSTIRRQSSAIHPMLFNETIAWDYDWESEERGEIVEISSCSFGPSTHLDMCKQLFMSGEYAEESTESEGKPKCPNT